MLSLNIFTALLALFFDRILGEPRKAHPLVGFGNIANLLEARLNKRNALFWRGIAAWTVAVLPITFLVYWLDQLIGGLWLGIICGWLAIGWQSLRQHGLAVLNELNKNNLDEARVKTAYIVSRDTSKLDETSLSKATIESVLENGSDAIFAPLFWLFIFGAPGVVFYRLCNTLDAMWGYRNPRFEQFGKFTARMDDLLNIIPARISALLYALCGNTKSALTAWQKQGKTWYSPNAGVVMATGAGALGLALGGAAVYHGIVKERPALGFGATPQAKDIKLAVQLIDRSVYLLMAISFSFVIIKIYDFPHT